MISKLESFWIKFILRFAIGFLFLFAALGQFNVSGTIPEETARKFEDKEQLLGREGIVGKAARAGVALHYNVKKFADGLAGGFKSTWVADIEVAGFTGAQFTGWFLYGLPYAFTLLAAMILSGIGTRIALRAGALLLVCLGLGKYLQGPDGIATTANDFLFALIICIGLFFYGLEKRPAQPATQP